MEKNDFWRVASESMRESWTIKGDHRLPLGSLCAIGGVGNKVSSARMELDGRPADEINKPELVKFP